VPDIEYDREGRDKQYLSINKHQKNARNGYSKWVSINIEKEVFDNADYGNFTHVVGDIHWADQEGNLWGMHQDYESVGMAKEQFAFFVNPENAQGRWHGYPIVPFSTGKYAISQELIALWVEKEILDADDVAHLVNKKRIG